MNSMGYRPAPASWTLAVARHIKSLSQSLVMDGSFARTETVEDCYPLEILEILESLVDIISFHYYGSGDISRVRKDCKIAKKYGKVFVAGEFGFFDSIGDYAEFLSEIDGGGGAGSLVWSLRPRSSRGGFKTHEEFGDGHW